MQPAPPSVVVHCMEARCGGVTTAAGGEAGPRPAPLPQYTSSSPPPPPPLNVATCRGGRAGAGAGGTGLPVAALAAVACCCWCCPCCCRDWRYSFMPLSCREGKPGQHRRAGRRSGKGAGGEGKGAERGGGGVAQCVWPRRTCTPSCGLMLLLQPLPPLPGHHPPHACCCCSTISRAQALQPRAGAVGACACACTWPSLQRA